MYEDLAPKMAAVMIHYSARVKEGELVVINASTTAEPLIAALFDAVLAAGGHPYLNLSLPGLNEAFFRQATDAQLSYVNPTARVLREQADVFITIGAEHNTKALSGIDPARFAKQQQVHQEVVDIFFRRLSSGELRYLHTMWPTNASAQQAEMSLHDLRAFIYGACALDQADPVAHWTTVKAQQERLVAWLAGKRRVEVRGPGVDLSFDMTDRLWVSCHGELNLPDGEIYTCPVEDSVNGHIAFSFPTIYAGQEVAGVRLTFKDGVATEASAAKNEAHLLAQLDIDAGARRLGEFAIGTNRGIQTYTGDTLFDEKIGGTIHMALGASVPFANGQNQSSIHWDIVHNMREGGEIVVDGEPFYRRGEFLVG